MKKTVIPIIIFMFIITACGRPSQTGSDTSTNANGKEVHTIDVTYLVAEDQSTHIAAENFKKTLEEESDGRLEVELYPNGQLYGSDREAIEAVQKGNVDMTIPALAPITSFNEKFKLFDLPFLFDDTDTVYEVLDGEIGENLLDDLKDDGFKGLAFAENGFHQISNNNGPIESLDDLKGLKLRTMESEVHTDSFKTLGANASPFEFGELYTALQQGTYDSIAVPISIFQTGKFYEVQDYLTISKHFYVPTILLMNDDFYNELPEDLQELVTDASEKYRDEQRELSQKQEEEMLEELEEEVEINELSDEQREEFRKATEPVYEKYEDEIGKDTIDEVLEKKDK